MNNDSKYLCTFFAFIYLHYTFVTFFSETAFQDGVITLYLLFHKMITGEGLSIHGSSYYSIFELDKELCRPDEFGNIDEIISTLIHQGKSSKICL